MKKRVIYLLVILGLSAITYAQETQKFESIAKVKLGINGFEAAYELPVSSKLVWENSIGIGNGYNVNKGSLNEYLFIDQANLFLSSHLKYLYNQQNRIDKGNKILNNSGNYIGLATKYNFGTNSRPFIDKSLITDLHWGIQRPLGNRFLFNLELGFGYLYDFDTSEGIFSPGIGLNFSYILFKK